MYFCSRHIALNQHLHYIKRSTSLFCPICLTTEETIHHFLLECPQYNHEQFILHQRLGHKASSLSFLLTSPTAIKHFLQYVNSTGRLKLIFGDVTLPPPRPDK
ncbi:hypothetical protein BDR06DRAFT_879181 [Suillus hirtellus]|nr:hypothetical protein BDR06DRAFT_896166 [Suillus hirtellus]KAG2056697.1 hypothetical protein BDR06DRAFT_879181 [Suillus hirtellus]